MPDLRVYLRVMTAKTETHTPLVINNTSEKFRKQSITALNELLKALPQDQKKNFHVYPIDLPDMQGTFDDMGDR